MNTLYLNNKLFAVLPCTGKVEYHFTADWDRAGMLVFIINKISYHLSAFKKFIQKINQQFFTWFTAKQMLETEISKRVYIPAYDADHFFFVLCHS